MYTRITDIILIRRVPESGHESTAKDLASDRPLTTPKLDGSKTGEFSMRNCIRLASI